jgi:vacuolar-type H+-ATPase subunit I/STV1
MREDSREFALNTGRPVPSHCTDEVVGAILSGWRYDISSLSPAMRTDYDQHLSDCAHCRSKQRLHRTVDVLLISVSSLSILAFLLAAVVMHRVEAITHVDQLHVHLHHTAMYISLEAVALAGLVFSTVLWILVAIMTPIPGFLGALVQQRIPADLRQRFSKDAA